MVRLPPLTHPRPGAITPSPGILSAVTFGRRCQIGAASLIAADLIVSHLIVIDPPFAMAALAPPGAMLGLIPAVVLIAVASWSARRRARLRRMRVQWSDLDQQWRDHGRHGNGAAERARLHRHMAALRPTFAQTLADARALGLT